MQTKLNRIITALLSILLFLSSFTAFSAAEETEGESSDATSRFIIYELGEDVEWSDDVPQTEYELQPGESHFVINNQIHVNTPGYGVSGWNVARSDQPDQYLGHVYSGDTINPEEEPYSTSLGETLILTPFLYEKLYYLSFIANADDAILISDDPSANSQSARQRLHYSDTITVYQEAIRQNYKLAGWALSENGEVVFHNRDSVDFSALFGESEWVELFAVWEKEADWTVRYDLGEEGIWPDGAPQTEYELSFDDEFQVTQYEPKYNGIRHYFGYWEIYKSTDLDTALERVSTGDTIYPDDSELQLQHGDILILKPHWNVRTHYRLNYNANAEDAYMIGEDITDGSRPVEKYYQYNDQITIYQNAIRENYKLVGWSLTPDGSADYKNNDVTDVLEFFEGRGLQKITLYAVWEVKLSGWIENDGSWYYYDDEGTAVTGWQEIEKETYYFDAEGRMQTGWQYIDEKWYYFNSKGVQQAVSITLDKSEITLKKGEVETVEAVVTPQEITEETQVVWSSSNETVATVDNGRITAVKGGKATITASVKDKIAAAEVSVVVPLERIELNKSETTLKKGETEKLEVTITPADTTDDTTATWGSSNEAVATVTDGTVTAVNAGTATITAKVGDKTATAEITVIQTGWVKEDGIWYYYDEAGASVKGWKKISGVWYYFDTEGKMQTGWKKISDKWYYFSGSGAMQTGWQKISEKWYYFNGSGAMLTGWQKISEKWYYFNGSGAMLTGWRKINDTWYYFNTSGAMLTGWQKISEKWYYFNGSGAMLTGWEKISNTWYYFESSGAMKTGWLKLNDKWYYFESSGKMVTGEKTINGKTYNFDSSGRCLNP